MKVKIETDEYTIYERRDGRFAIRDSNGTPINGDQKIEILLQHELIVAVLPKSEPKGEEAESEAPAAAETQAEPEAEPDGEETSAGDDK